MASSHTQAKDEELNLQLQSASNYDGSDENHWKCRSNRNLEIEIYDRIPPRESPREVDLHT